MHSLDFVQQDGYFAISGNLGTLLGLQAYMNFRHTCVQRDISVTGRKRASNSDSSAIRVQFIPGYSRVMLSDFYFAAGGAEVSRSACLSVCLFARISQKSHVQTSRNFLPMLPVAVARSSSDNRVIRYVFPVLWTTSSVHMMGICGVRRGLRPRNVSQREATQRGAELKSCSSAPLCVASR